MKEDSVLVERDGIQLLVDADKTDVHEASRNRDKLEQAMRQRDGTRDEQAVAPGGQQNVAPREAKDVQAIQPQPVASVLKGSRWPKAEIKSVDIERDVNSARKRIQVFRVTTLQENDPPFWGRVDIYVEMKDFVDIPGSREQQEKLYFGSASFRQMRRYGGRTSGSTFTFHISCHDLNRPRVTAYCVEYWDSANAIGPLARELKQVRDLGTWLAEAKGYSRLEISGFAYH